MLLSARRRLVDLVVPDLVIEELIRVLTRKLHARPDRVREYTAALRRIGEIVPAPTDPEAVTGHPPDDAILACAVAARVRILVTGDRRHLLPVGEHRGVLVLTPQGLLAELAAGR